MASNRNFKIGTIFSRITGLIRAGAMTPDDKPIWYNIYRAFPPKYEPINGRSVDIHPIPNILYPEDRIRAIFHTKIRRLPAGDLQNQDVPDITIKVIGMCQKLLEERKELTETEAVNQVIKTLKKEGFLRSKSAKQKGKSVQSEKPLAENIEPIPITEVLDDFNKQINPKYSETLDTAIDEDK